MSNESPAAHLSRLKRSYPRWTFWKGATTGSWWAAPPKSRPGQPRLWAPSLARLEARVADEERGRKP